MSEADPIDDQDPIPPTNPSDRVANTGDPERHSPLPIPVIDFEELSQGAGTILIHFEGSMYTLKRTRNKRLVLHK